MQRSEPAISQPATWPWLRKQRKRNLPTPKTAGSGTCGARKVPTNQAAIQTDVVLFCVFSSDNEKQKTLFHGINCCQCIVYERKEKTQKFKSCTEEPKPNIALLLTNPGILENIASAPCYESSLDGCSYLENKFHWFAVTRSIRLLNCWALHCWWTVTMHVFSIDIPFDHLISLFSFLKQFFYFVSSFTCTREWSRVCVCVSAIATNTTRSLVYIFFIVVGRVFSLADSSLALCEKRSPNTWTAILFFCVSTFAYRVTIESKFTFVFISFEAFCCCSFITIIF